MTSDDYGVSKGHLAWIKSQIFPYDDDIKMSDFGKWIDELKMIGAIIPFEVNGEKYLYIKTFAKHQKVDHPSSIRNPEPPGNILDSLENGSRAARAGNPLLTETETEAETETETSIGGSKAEKLKKQIQADKEKFSAAWKENLEFYRTKYPGIDLDFAFANVLDWIDREPGKAHKASKGDLNLFYQRWLNKEKPRFFKPTTHERIRPNTEEVQPLSLEERIAHKKALLEQYKGRTEPRLVNAAKAIERDIAELQGQA
jgi:hypothetical protein